MPLYRYQCPRGHEVELIRPMGVDTVLCPCGVDSERRTVYRVSHVGRVAIPQDQKNYRQSFNEYQEAVAEVADSYNRGNNERAPHEQVSEPNYFGLAKSRAQSQGAAIK